MNIFDWLFGKKLKETELRPLGRIQPPDREHEKKHPYSAPLVQEKVEIELPLPVWHTDHDQGQEGACVGFGWQMAKAILDGVRGDPVWLWNEAKMVDVWPDTNPGDNNGTSVRAGGDILRTKGNKLLGSANPDLKFGIKSNEWATNINQMRTALFNKIPVVIGVGWYENFDRPVMKANGEWWIGEGDLKLERGGHCVCVYAASDDRSAVKIKNSWGLTYPEVWLPYTIMQRLLNEGGEAALINDITDTPAEPETPTRATIKLGSKGKDVEYLQSSLKWLGFSGIKVVDGKFGVNTDKAVKLFQKSEKLKQDGIVGKVTWKNLEARLKKKSQVSPDSSFCAFKKDLDPELTKTLEEYGRLDTAVQEGPTSSRSKKAKSSPKNRPTRSSKETSKPSKKSSKTTRSRKTS